MSRLRCLLSLFGGAVGALLFTAVAPVAVGHADDCDGQCTLVSGGDATNVLYTGFRPIVTDWYANQPVDVQVSPDDGSSFISGSYNVGLSDLASPIVDDSVYHYDDFTPAAANPAGDYSDGLSGATVFDTTLFPGIQSASSETAGILNSLYVLYPDGKQLDTLTLPGLFTNTFESTLFTSNTTPFASADFIQFAGQDAPIMLWNELFGTSVPDVSGVLPPDPWFPLG